MAANLVRAGHRVTGLDPSGSALERAAASGVRVAGSAAAAVAGAELVLTMLPTGRHVLEAYRELVDVASGALFVDCSTIAVGDAWIVADLARTAGHRLWTRRSPAACPGPRPAD